MTTETNLSASLEDYLEALLVLVQEKPVARVRDIAQRVGVSMASVNTALKRLVEQGLVRHEPYEFVELTEAGMATAGRIRRRHETLRRFLSDVLSLPQEIAEADACKMEHGLHPVTVTQFQRFLEFLDSQAGEELAPCVQALREPEDGAGANVRSGEEPSED